jgi:hypothetical protein
MNSANDFIASLRKSIEKLIVSKVAACYGTDGQFLCSQELATGPYPELDEFSSYHHRNIAYCLRCCRNAE